METVAAKTKRAIAEWAVKHYPDLTAYVAVDYTADDEWGGSAPGPNGGTIHLISQTESECIYGETTDDVDEADYLATDAGILQDGSPDQIVEELLGLVFGDQSTWPDTYAQTHGWKL